MKTIEPVTDREICSHCRTAWVVPHDRGNGCCAEDDEHAPVHEFPAPPAAGETGERA
jgi:hypothetical protein